MRTLTTYLEVFELSEWERHWQEYRRDGYFAYTRTQTTFFIVLGVLVAAFSVVTKRPSAQQPEAWVGASVLIVYCFLLCGMGYRGWWDSEEAARSRWAEIKKNQEVGKATSQGGSA
jgi:hypothetical protein